MEETTKNENKTSRHYLAKAEPKYWTPRELWRVRAMRNGERLQWQLKAGRGDPSSTGRALALAEWARIKGEIVKGDTEKFGVFEDLTAVEWQQTQRGEQTHTEYLKSGMREKFGMSQSDFTAFLQWLDYRRNGGNTNSPAALSPKSFSDLIETFKLHLKSRFEGTKPGLRSKENLTSDRYEAHLRSLKHLAEMVGKEMVEPMGEFHIGELRLSQILSRYRELIKTEVGKPKRSGYWANELFTTARLFTTFLANSRMLSATPPNIAALTARYQMEGKAKPMPKEIVLALFNAADEIEKAYILLSLNCGFRNAELAIFDRSQIKTIAGRVCVEKRRGKTGVPLAIPLWKSTQDAIAKVGNAKGLVFTTSKGFPLVHGKTDSVATRYNRLRKEAIKTLPEVKDYCFENFRDTGASWLNGINPMLTPLYLAQQIKGEVKCYVGLLKGETAIPQNLGEALDGFGEYLGLA